MLDEKDLQAIASLIDDRIKKSEGRMMSVIDKQTNDLRDQMMSVIDKQTNDLKGQMTSVIGKQTNDLKDQMMAVIESEVNPKFQILAEGQEALLEKMIPENRIEDLEAELVVQKMAIKNLNERLTALEEAV